MISRISESTDEAVSSMQAGCSHAVESLNRLEAARGTFELIFESVGQINDCNLSIATAAKRQAEITREVDQNLGKIRSYSYNTAKSAEQLKLASADFKSLTQSLESSISRFSS
ncbi:hypothetical protein D9M68_802130 [compost metagenome]